GVIGRGIHSEISTYIEKALHNDFIGNVIDVCPVGALTDRTFRFKNRVWFTKPVDAHRDCPTCSGKVTLWYKGDEVLRVTGRKDEFGEVEEFICNTCRFDTKQTSDWTLEKPTPVDDRSVIAANHYYKFNPPAVIHTDKKLQEANEEQAARTDRLTARNIELAFVLEKLIMAAIVFVITFVIAIYSTLTERRVAGFMHDRYGPAPA